MEEITPCPRAEKPQHDSRRGEITVRIKLRTRQRGSEGSNKPYAHQDPGTPQRLSKILPNVRPCPGKEP